MSRFFAFVLPVLLVASLGCLRPAEKKAAPREVAVPDDPLIVTHVEGMEGDGKLPVAPFPHEPGDLTCEDPGLDPRIEAALPEIERLERPPVDPTAPPIILPPPPGLGLGLPNGARADDPPAKPPAAFSGRSGAAKKALLERYGGNAESEKAVELALAWLAKQQKKDGGWEYDQGSKEHRVAATGMVLLAFLGAGETHKVEKGKYKDVVEKGLQYLMKATPAKGAKAGEMGSLMYEQAIGTMALVEAYGMTKDPVLKPVAQAAVNYIQKSQAFNGSWGYGSGSNGDTSIVGWQIQALKTAQLTKDLIVDDRVIKKAIKFLDLVAAGERKSMYGYADDKGAAPGTSLTAVGLICRYYIDAWGPSHPGMIDGVAGLMKHPPLYKGGDNVPAVSNMYYYYYATQVVRYYGDEDWKTWNEGPKDDKGMRKGGMRDWLVGQQVKKEGDNLGSWDSEQGWFGTSCGRIGTTAMCVLTLEVYYRFAPTEKKAENPKK